MSQATIVFGVIGINHGHIYDQVNALLKQGAKFAAFYAPEPELASKFATSYPQTRRVNDPREILEDSTIQLVTGAGIPSDRAELGIEVMRHGKDYLTDKPGFTTLEQLEKARQVQAETGRIYSVYYGERLDNAATTRAAELVHGGAIGQVVQTIGLGPHRINLPSRPEWFFQKERYGGILVDIASHQMDQFLYFTNSSQARVVTSQVANYKYPEYPGLEDFGDALLQGEGGTGYVRVDWFTPAGLHTWGDTRLTVLGTEGYIEVRKNIDLAGRVGASHLFLVDQHGTHYVDCNGVELPYVRQLMYDVLNRTETAMSQAHCFLASELALRAEAQASRLGHLT